MQDFSKILVANRGEIASRIIRTCHDMGIGTVAVFSDADSDAPFVREADEATRLGPAPSPESYLRGEAIIKAARRIGAQAIHPGYGFLAENADFARACADADITFIGPSPEAISLLGSKKASKAVVAEAGVPIVPSFDLESPDEIVYPVLLKASVGGGGKGMHIVRNQGELAPALESAKRIATTAFGDDTILMEKYVESPRHIEIQILGDCHGTLLHLYERECSIQRRHQKIIEESPAPNLPYALRDKIASAAVAVGKAANYHNAGTVEFILAPNGEFYFLEVNTRLQVEHPITECVTGIDLVREQIRIARGEALGFSQGDVVQRGAAIECRLYAEDCDNDFLPCSGTIGDFHVAQSTGLRVDSGVESGSEISIHYDPMLAKVITSGAGRSEALRRMQRSLRRLSALGTTTNREFLLRVLAHPQFAKGTINTNFLTEHRNSLELRAPPEELRNAALMAATIARLDQRLLGRQVLPTLRSGYRNSRWRESTETFVEGETANTVHYIQEESDKLSMRVDDGRQVEVLCIGSFESVSLTLQIGEHRSAFRVCLQANRVLVQVDGRSFDFAVVARFPDRAAVRVEGSCLAPMPGCVVQVLVENGATVAEGDTLLILEAMKMEHRIRAHRSGVVGELDVKVGEQVSGDQVLAVVETEAG
ncbi:MAG: ATP-grasp domain-containing protein [Myxococcales bacterium]|nr:ATP-grasp domain-containing protein [Myxococcales bacterium]